MGSRCNEHNSVCSDTIFSCSKMFHSSIVLHSIYTCCLLVFKFYIEFKKIIAFFVKMSLDFLLSVVLKDGKMCMGNDGNLLFTIKKDLEYFKNLTKNNTVVMGYETWRCLPVRPLPGRKNIVLTRANLKSCKNVLYMTVDKFKSYVKRNKREHIFCIGGGKIFKTMMSIDELKPHKIFMTHIRPCKHLLDEMKYDVVFDTEFLEHYKLYAYSPEYMHISSIKYRFLHYVYTDNYHEEYKYLSTLQTIIQKADTRQDRTKIGVKSIFSNKLEFDISNSIPLLTTKTVSFKNILEELLWFCRGETDSNILKEKGINIWKGNTTREFLDSRGLDYNEGELGPMYGFQMRHFGAKYPSKKSGFDQLQYVEDLLKNDPFSRRIMMSYINPPDYHKGVLLPCHHYIQFYVEEINKQKYLSCFFNMRSSDFALASCYNIVSYSILTYILALKYDMKPKSIVYHAVDCHVYLNHIEQVKEQLNRELRPFPALHLNENIKEKDWKDIQYSDFELVGYLPNPAIKMDMAI